MTDQPGFAEGHPLTVVDLESMPDDGRRYELIGGTLFVDPGPTWTHGRKHELIDGLLVATPSPTRSHQRMALRVAFALDVACPPELEVLIAPFDVRTDFDTVVQPDVLVARQSDLGETSLQAAPVLAVEVMSQSSQLYDRSTKMAHYARIGVPSYWLLNPVEPGAIEIYELDHDGQFQLVASGAGEETLAVERPFPLTVCPARLLDGRRAD